ncbi:MAG: ribonuclease HIII [Limisphaerales bacterium]|jgi:ribonuclease HIII
MDKIRNYTVVLTKEQGDELLQYLKKNDFEIDERPHARFFASKPNLSITLYDSMKLVVQGKNSGEFIEFVLEPLILKQAKLGYESVLNPEYYSSRIGVDESGKGDYFGPLCVAGVYVNEKIIKQWEGTGIRDSKQINSDKSIRVLAEMIRKTTGCITEVVVIGNEAYNRLYEKLKNVNKILAWGHSRVIENLLSKQQRLNPPPEFIICDQFANREAAITGALMALGRQIKVVQRHRAESDLAVAAASILARREFIDRLERMSNEYGFDFPRGCSNETENIARDFVKKYGEDMLKKVAKIHFKTTAKVLDDYKNSNNSDPL